MLLIVAGITIFSFSGREETGEKIISDYINVALLVVALLLNVFALSAILFRLTSFGLTPNRIATLGANLTLFGHLMGVLRYYTQFLMGKSSIAQIENWISKYLPVYTVWTAIITFIFPFIFSFK